MTKYLGNLNLISYLSIFRGRTPYCLQLFGLLLNREEEYRLFWHFIKKWGKSEEKLDMSELRACILFSESMLSTLAYLITVSRGPEN